MFLDLIENDMYTNFNPINYHVLFVACPAAQDILVQNVFPAITPTTVLDVSLNVSVI